MSHIRRSRAGTGGSLRRGAGVAGFTVLELLLVIAVIAVLGALVLGAGRYARESGRASRATAELAGLAAALESYRLEQGDYPQTDQPARLLQALIGRRGPTGAAIAAGAMLEAGRFSTGSGADPFLNDAAELIDPWGAPYRYAYKSALPWDNPGYVLYSAGPDGLVSAALLSGGFPNPTLPANVDNLWACPP